MLALRKSILYFSFMRDFSLVVSHTNPGSFSHSKPICNLCNALFLASVSKFVYYFHGSKGLLWTELGLQ